MRFSFFPGFSETGALIWGGSPFYVYYYTSLLVGIEKATKKLVHTDTTFADSVIYDSS